MYQLDTKISFDEWIKREDRDLTRRIKSLADTFDLDKLRDEISKETELK